MRNPGEIVESRSTLDLETNIVTLDFDWKTTAYKAGKTYGIAIRHTKLYELQKQRLYVPDTRFYFQSNVKGRVMDIWSPVPNQGNPPLGLLMELTPNSDVPEGTIRRVKISFVFQ